MPNSNKWTGIDLIEFNAKNYVQVGVRTETDFSPLGWVRHYWVSGMIDGTWFAVTYDSDSTVENKKDAYEKFAKVEQTLLRVTA